METGIGVAIVLPYELTRFKTTMSFMFAKRQNSKARNENAKKQNPFLFFFLQSKNESGGW